MTKKVINLDSDKINELFKKLQDRDVEIKGASVKDALCTYNYELLIGPSKGDKLSHKGAHIVHDDLQVSFDELSVFFAHLDDAYTGNDNATTIETLRSEPETDKYYVDGFSISGVEENKSVVLSGWKEVSNGSISFSTPKVKFNGNYLYLHQLKQAIYNAIEEVDQYRNGKVAPQHDENQTEMTFENDTDATFEAAAVPVIKEETEA